LAERTFRAGIYGYSVRRANRIIAISEYTRRAVLNWYGVPPSRTATVLLGFDASDLPAKQSVAGLPDRYWYYPAISRPHKNHLTLFRTWHELKRRGELDHHLVLTGQKTAYWRWLEREIRRLELSEIVLHLGLLARGQVGWVYANAAGVLLPSIFEGFGLPVVEAVAHRKRIVVSPLEVYEELGVPGECQVDFADADAVQRAMRIPGPTRLLKPLVSWQDCAHQTLAILRQAAEEGR
jgi:glycosyltransferase involved in cell wall biosynthesis